MARVGAARGRDTNSSPHAEVLTDGKCVDLVEVHMRLAKLDVGTHTDRDTEREKEREKDRDIEKHRNTETQRERKRESPTDRNKVREMFSYVYQCFAQTLVDWTVIYPSLSTSFLAWLLKLRNNTQAIQNMCKLNESSSSLFLIDINESAMSNEPAA